MIDKGLQTACRLVLVAMLVIGFLVPCALADNEVVVYGEAAWTDSDVVVYLYTDADEALMAGRLCSFGVKVTYPPELNLDVANSGTDKDTWYIGDEDYVDLYTEAAGEVILVGGRLDPLALPGGVHGTRVLLGKLTFTHSGAAMPPALGLTLGRGGNYSNFVTSTGTVFDGTGTLFQHPGDTVPIKIAERGDADADGDINSLDFQVAYQIFIGNEPWTVFADCDPNEDLDSLDFQCMYQKFIGN